MSEQYFVILGSPDGCCYIEQMTREELLKGIRPASIRYPGEEGMEAFGRRKILSELPDDTRNFEDMVIIKGEIIVPKAKQVVTEYELG